MTSSPEDTSVEISTSKILEMLLTLPLWPRARCLPSVVMPTRLTTTKPLLPPSLVIAGGKEADALASFSEFPSAQSLGYPRSQSHILVKKYCRLLLYSELKDMLNRFYMLVEVQLFYKWIDLKCFARLSAYSKHSASVGYCTGRIQRYSSAS